MESANILIPGISIRIWRVASAKGRMTIDSRRPLQNIEGLIDAA
jgi:hypothetical protein